MFLLVYSFHNNSSDLTVCVSKKLDRYEYDIWHNLYETFFS